MEVEIEGGEEKSNELEIINENKKITSQKKKKLYINLFKYLIISFEVLLMKWRKVTFDENMLNEIKIFLLKNIFF